MYQKRTQQQRTQPSCLFQGDLQWRQVATQEFKNFDDVIVLPSSGNLVGLSSRDFVEAATLHLHRSTTGRWEEASVIKLCMHNRRKLDVLGMLIEGQEVIVAACTMCEDIKLVEPKTGNISVAFNSFQDFSYYRMCQGDAGRLWVASKTCEVHELNCNTRTFTETGRTVTPLRRLFPPHGLQYLPPPHNALLVSGLKGMWVLCADTGAVLWTVRDFCRHLLVIPHCQVVLWNTIDSLVLLNPADGSRLQKVPLAENHYLVNMCCYKDQLIVHYLEVIYEGSSKLQDTHTLNTFTVTSSSVSG